MNTNKVLIAVIILAAVVAGAVYFSGKSETDPKMMVEDKTKETGGEMKDTNMPKDPEKVSQDNTMPEQNSNPPLSSGGWTAPGGANPDNDGGVFTPGVYKDYSAETVLAEQKAGQRVVLFFYASWCPECKAADTAFKANPDKIPSKTTLLKTNYDIETELKTKYGVTHQHTFVQIDNNGSLVTKWVSGDIDMLMTNIK